MSTTYQHVQHLEGLEGRRLLSADLTGRGTLRVSADGDAPTAINVSLDGRDVVVRQDRAEVGRFAAGDVRRVLVRGGAGDDRINVDLGQARARVAVFAGGGGGDDAVTSAGFISGGDGDDTLTGSDGRDLIRGGAGDDVIAGAAGDDRLFGGDGDDQLDGGAGRDRLADRSGVNVFDADDEDRVLDGSRRGNRA